jgi:hypothetical protein
MTRTPLHIIIILIIASKKLFPAILSLHTPLSLHQPRDLRRQIIRLTPRRRLGIDSNCILCATRPCKRSPILKLLDERINPVLRARRLNQLPLCIRRLEDIAVADLDAYKSVR